MPLLQMAGPNDYPAPTLFLNTPPAPNLVRSPGALGARISQQMIDEYNALSATGPVPNVQAQALAQQQQAAAVGAHARRRKLLWIAGGGVAVVLVGALLLRRA